MSCSFPRPPNESRWAEKENKSLKAGRGKRNTGDNRATGDDINPNTGRAYKRYCWSHGCCGHWGRNCPQKMTVHKHDANFKNRMEGSDTLCFPVQKWLVGGANMSSQLQFLNTIGQSYSYPCVYPVAPILYITPHITAKADSGATSHYLKSEHIPSLTNVTPLLHGPSAMLPNNTTITATHQGTLPFAAALSYKAKNTLVFPRLSN